MATVGDLRKRLDQDFTALAAKLGALVESAAEGDEDKEEVRTKLEVYLTGVAELKGLLSAHPELRVGNILSAVGESDVLLSAEGKGLLPDLKRVLDGQAAGPELVGQLVGGIKQRHEAMLKFLEAEAKVEIKEG